MYRIQVRQDHVNGAWYWRIVGGNGQVVLTSETYATRSNANRAARTFFYRSGISFGDTSLDEIPR